MSMSVGHNALAAISVATANVARLGAQKATMRIATNSEVAGTAWDGARYAQMLALKTQKVVYEVNEQRLGIYEAFHLATDQVGQMEMQTANKIHDLFMAALSHEPGSSQRLAIKAEYDAVTSALQGAYPANNLGLIQGVQAPLDASHGLLEGLQRIGRSLAGFYNTLVTPLNAAVDLATSSTADIRAQLATIQNFRDNNIAPLDVANGGELNRIDRIRDINSRFMDTTDRYIGALVDTDLAAESARLAAAQAREQLAITAMNIANGTTRTALNLFA